MAVTTVSKTEECFKAKKNKKGAVRYVPTSSATEQEKQQLERYNKLLDYVSEYFKSDISCDY